MTAPKHSLQDIQPAADTSCEAVHKSPLETTGDLLPQHQQPQTNEQSCGNHIPHRSPVGSHKPENSGVSATVCSNCSTTTTPLWRRAPNGETICNACGLYLKARNTIRPPWLKRNSIKKPPTQPAHESTGGSCPGDGHCNGTGGSSTCDGCPAYNQHQTSRQALVCANCHTTTTPLWRRDEAGNTICNACGLYYKLHNVHRPVTMKRSVIKRRKRVALASSPQPHHHHHHIAPSVGGEDGDISDHTPGLSSGETGSGTEEEDSAPILRKRKAGNEPVRNLKRIDIGSRPVPAIEDYIIPKRGGVVQIHNHHRPSSVYHNGTPYQRPVSPVSSEPSVHVTTSAPYSSHGISALLNPTTSSTTSSVTTQLPPMSLPQVSSPPSYPQPGPTHYPQSSQAADLAAVRTQQVLAAHRQELQREVTNLSVLLTRTAAMLSNLDHAMAATGQPSSADPLASIMALSNAAASSAYVQPPTSTSGSAQQSSMNLPPLSAHQTHHAHQLPPVMIPHAHSGSPPPTSPQQLPTPPSNSPIILSLPVGNHYSRA
ncbi:hypothetical protein BC937DRAFT_91958, partial [Endogone sp. FLAS-F59071]